MSDTIEDLVERLRTIEQQLATIMQQLPSTAAAADQTVAGGTVDTASVRPAASQSAVGQSS